MNEEQERTYEQLVSTGVVVGKWALLRGVALGALVATMMIGATTFFLVERQMWARVDVLWNWYVHVQELTQLQLQQQQAAAAPVAAKPNSTPTPAAKPSATPRK